jgi:hypothetical protein
LATAARSSNETLRSPSIEGDGLDLLFSSFNRHVILLHMLTGIRSVHFVGIGGTAMASAAVAMQEKGYTVTGSDQNVYPPMSTFLAERKLPVMLGYAEQNLAHKPDLVVIGNAISRGNPEAEAVRPQVALLLAAGIVEGVFHSRETVGGGDGHTREDDNNIPANVGIRAQRIEPELFDWRDTEQFQPGRAIHRQRMVHHRRRRV